MAFALADHRRFGRAMDAIMLLRQIEPRHAHRIIGAGLQQMILRGVAHIPKQLGIIVEIRIAADALDRPCADGQRIMLAAHGRRELGDQPAIGSIGAQHPVRLIDHHALRLRLVWSDTERHQAPVPAARILAQLRHIDIGDIRHANNGAGAELHLRPVQRLQRLGRGMEPLGKRFGQIAIAQMFISGLRRALARQVGHERPVGESGGDRDQPRRRHILPAFQRSLRRVIQNAAFLKPIGRLKAL